MTDDSTVAFTGLSLRMSRCSWMQQPIDNLKTNLSGIRTGRASPGVPDRTGHCSNEIESADHGPFSQTSARTDQNWCAGMLDIIKVAAYGEQTPSQSLKSLASVAVRGPQLLAVSVYDPSVMFDTMYFLVYLYQRCLQLTPSYVCMTS